MSRRLPDLLVTIALAPARRVAPRRSRRTRTTPARAAGATPAARPASAPTRPTATACAGSATTAAPCPASRRTRSASTCASGTRRRKYRSRELAGRRRCTTATARPVSLEQPPPRWPTRSGRFGQQRQREPAGRRDALRARLRWATARRARSTRTALGAAVAASTTQRRPRRRALPRALPRRARRCPPRCACGGRARPTMRVLVGRPARRAERAADADGRRRAGPARRRPRTGADGVASVPFTPTQRRRRAIAATTGQLASTPAGRLRADRAGAAAQRPAPGRARLADRRARPRRRPRSRSASAARRHDDRHARRRSSLGEPSRDKVTHQAAPTPAGAGGRRRRGSSARSARRGAIRCDGDAGWRRRLATRRRRARRRRRRRSRREPGWYVYQLSRSRQRRRAPARRHRAATPLERVKVEAQPHRHDAGQRASRSTPGAPITDTVVVEGLGGETATIQAALYGPFADAATRSTATARRSGRARSRRPATASTCTGAVHAAPTPGYYTYRESIAESEFVRPARDAVRRGRRDDDRAAAARRSRPRSARRRPRPGARSPTRVVVTGARHAHARRSTSSSGGRSRRARRSRARARRSGPARSPPTATAPTRPRPSTLDAAGYYTYRESIAATTPHDGAPRPACGEVVRDDVRARRADGDDGRLRTTSSGPGDADLRHASRSPASARPRRRSSVELFGPFASRAAIDCDGHAATGRARSRRRATATSARRGSRVPRVGLLRLPRADRRHADRRRGADRVRDEAETSLGAPLILTGRGDRPARDAGAVADAPAARRRVRARAASGSTPGLGVGIDTRSTARSASRRHQSRRLVARRRGAGRASGTVLIAGHVDSAKRGRGRVLRAQGRAPRATRSRSRPQDGRTLTYRVTSRADACPRTRCRPASTPAQGSAGSCS